MDIGLKHQAIYRNTVLHILLYLFGYPMQGAYYIPCQHTLHVSIPGTIKSPWFTSPAYKKASFNKLISSKRDARYR